METSRKASDYMLLFRGNDWYRSIPPEQMQTVADQWIAWFERLRQEGKALAGNPLEADGVMVSGRNGRVVADGPFTESKEAIGGYFLLRVADFQEAITIAQQCPGLPYGAKVEVRPVAETCALAEGLVQEAELAGKAETTITVN